MNDERRTHSSQLFSVRLWLEDLSDEADECRGTVRHVTSGEAIHFRDFERLEDFLSTMTVRHASTDTDTMDTTRITLTVMGEVFAAFDEHDLDRFRALLADDAVLVVAGSAHQFDGPDAVVAAVRTTLEALPDLRVTVTNMFADGERGVFEAVREGTNDGPIRLPGAEHSPTGRRVRLSECVTFEVRDGKVARMVPYSDQLDAMRQLGLVQSPSASEA